MKNIFLSFSNLETTLIVFTIVWVSFFIIPLHYNLMGKEYVRNLQKKSIFLDWHFWIPCLLYTVLFGFRWNYYYDWMQYHDDFIYIDRPDIVRESTERGYLFVNKVLSMMGFNFYSIFLLEGFVYITSIYYLFKDNRLCLLLVLPIVFIMNRTGLNISRQYFAISLLIIAYTRLLDKDKISFFIIAVAASTIHTSAIIFIPFFYFSKYLKTPSFNITILIYLFTLLLMPFFQNLLAYISGFIQEKVLVDKLYTMDYILDDRFEREMTLHRIIVASFNEIVYICLFYLLRPFINKKLYTIILIGIYAMFFKNLAGPHEIFSRTFYYITIFTSMGFGILFYLSFIYYKRIPSYLLFFAMLACLQIFYSLYPSIIDASKNTLTNTMIIYK